MVIGRPRESNPSNPRRWVWDKAFLLALGGHLTLFALLFAWSNIGFPREDITLPGPMIRTALEVSGREPTLSTGKLQDQALGEGEPQHQEYAISKVIESSKADSSSLEPDARTISQLVQSVVTVARHPTVPAAPEALRQKAVLLQEISNATEVSRMATAIRQALNLGEAENSSATMASTQPCDVDQSILTDAERREENGKISIRETMLDPNGGYVKIVTTKSVNPQNGEPIYEQIISQSGQEPFRLTVTRDEYEEALKRYQPFELINRFPLVRQLHHQAIVPILRRFSPVTDQNPDPPETHAKTRR